MLIATKPVTVCVVGAGYVGLPLAQVFARSHRVISFDIDVQRVKRLSAQAGGPNHSFTADPRQISEADFIPICVPTPLSRDKRPDMSYIKEAAATVGRHMKMGAVVIIESSVYPGATEELLKPILERESGYEYGHDFKLAYSPERISPGDCEHSVDKITKIVAACDEETLDQVVDLYYGVTPNIFRASTIRVAEAAKLVENTQRDVNIALVNELAMMFEKMGLDTTEVLEAAATKWNFHRYSPGLVGGYCIPVVPHFLVQKAEEYGYRPQVILASRAANESMPRYLAEVTIRAINEAGKVIRGSRVMIMGCTYKENVSDTRETPVREVARELRGYGVTVYGYDPLVENGERDFGFEFTHDLGAVPKMDGIILNLAHDVFAGISLNNLTNAMNPHPVVVDVRGFFSPAEVRNDEIIYKRL